MASALIFLLVFIGIALILGISKGIDIIVKTMDILETIFVSIYKFIINTLGRKWLDYKAFIPAEFDIWEEFFDNPDNEKICLAKYEPKNFNYLSPNKIEYSSKINGLFRQSLETNGVVDIAQISSICHISDSLPYDRLFTFLDENTPEYPVRLPNNSTTIDPPPKWTWMEPINDEPTFAPPYYLGGWSFLNRFVDNVYKTEKDKYTLALPKKDKFKKLIDERNQVLKALEEDADKKYHSTISKQEQIRERIFDEHELHKKKFINAFYQEKNYVQDLFNDVNKPEIDGLLARIELALRTIKLPSFISNESNTEFDSTSGIVIHEHQFPDLSSIEWIKLVELKSGKTSKSLNQKEKKYVATQVFPAISLRLAAELIRLDDEDLIKAIVINGWSDYTEKSTGQRKRAYCSSLFATKEQILNLNLKELDPAVAFSSLKGIAAKSLELTPIAPVLRLDTNDARFIDSREIIDHLTENENLAAMDWDDFEHLCRELFEKAFATSGAEVKVTQASRDQGVDAIIFDPDPLRGGKIIIQAKRYTNTVDVAAVRELYGAVINEGAIKGILVTTSQYGPEAYTFSKDKPITLLNGQELLGLLDQYGYKFKIDLAEAKLLV